MASSKTTAVRISRQISPKGLRGRTAKSSRWLIAPWLFAPWLFAPWLFAPWLFAPWLFAPWLFAPWLFAPWLFAPWLFAPWLFAPWLEPFRRSHLAWPRLSCSLVRAA